LVLVDHGAPALQQAQGKLWGRSSYEKGGVTHPTINARCACVDHGEPSLVAGGGVEVRWWFGDEEEQGEHAGAEDGEVLDDVEVGEHSSLAVELAVDVGHGGMGAGTAEGVSSSVSSEEGFELGDLIGEGLVAAGEVADHAAFVRGRAAGEHGGEEGCSAGAADVAGEVGEAGDVVALGLLYADVGDGIDGDEEEGESGGLEAAEEDEAGIADGEVHGVHGDQREGKHAEAVEHELAGVDLAGEEAHYGHHAHHHESGG
jgi:hypothetical protein